MPIMMTSRKVEGDHWEWKETARWVKFEEDVEEVFFSIVNVNVTIYHLNKDQTQFLHFFTIFTFFFYFYIYKDYQMR